MPSKQVVLKDHPEVARVVRAAFPGYRKKTAYVVPATKCTLSDTFWSGGTRSEYVALDLVTLAAGGAPQYDPPQFGGPPTAPTVEIPPGAVVVSAGTFCGKPATAFIYVHPSNLQQLLPFERATEHP